MEKKNTLVLNDDFRQVLQGLRALLDNTGLSPERKNGLYESVRRACELSQTGLNMLNRDRAEVAA